MKLEAEVIVTDGECVPSQRSLMKNERNPFLSKEIILLEESKMRKDENTTFVCKNCSTPVAPLTNGSYRNHCPQCLYSLHVDIRPGDRQNTCHGLMRPIDYRQHSQKGYQLLHECTRCKNQQWNTVAQDTQQPDHFIEWLAQTAAYH